MNVPTRHKNWQKCTCGAACQLQSRGPVCRIGSSRWQSGPGAPAGCGPFFHHIAVLGKGHLLLRCKILRRPLDFPAGVVYSKGNFILNKTLRQTIHAGTRKRENRRRIWRGASGFAGGQHSYHCRVRRRTFAGAAPRYRRLQNRALGLCFTSGMLCRVQFGWNRGV